MRKSLRTLTLISFVTVLYMSVTPGENLFAQGKKNSKSPDGYGNASYTVGKAGQFMREWNISGPYPIVRDSSTRPTDEVQQKAFNEEDNSLTFVTDKKKPTGKGDALLAWSYLTSKEDIVDLDAYFKNKDYASAYAMAEIKSDSDQKVYFAFGSDDGIKVLVNGNVVHNNWIPRAVTPDEDLVPVTLKKGSNQLIIKVQDMEGGWGFTARILDKAAMSDKLVDEARKGRKDEVLFLLAEGADPNRKNKTGLTAYSAAKIYGRADIIKLLTEKGAAEIPIPTGKELVDYEYSQLQGKKASGIAVLVAKDGKVIYENGFGYANIASNQLITPQTKFRIGSITKQFIGSAILKLQEEGKISVQDKLSKFIPDFPRGSEVTVHHLLTHTSGIHSYTNKNDFIARVTSPISEDSLVAIIKKEPYDFNPGERFLYNNSGFFLLGHIIRKVTGKFYGDYLQEQFFKPLGMNNTGVYSNAVKIEKEAIGYKKEDGKYSADINWDMSWAGGAGSLYSTVQDLFLWNEAIFTGKVLKPESMKAAFTSVLLNNGSTPIDGKYGYGWFLGSYRGLETIEHGGGLHGFSTRITRFPSENMTVVMLTNVIPTEVTLNPNVIAEYFIWDKLAPQSSFGVDNTVSENIKVYEGRYDFGNGMVMTVTSQGSNLFAQLTGQANFPIFPSAPGEYFWKVVEAKVKFIKNENGEVTHGDFSQGSLRVNLPKLKDEKIISVDPAVLELYVGKYDLGDDQVTISRENDKLYAQTKTSPRFEVKALSETEFTIQELNAKVIFVKEGNIKAKKFILDYAGQRKEVPRME